MRRTLVVVALCFGILASVAWAQRAGRGPGGPGGMRMGPPVMAAVDTDRDGSLSAEEIAKAAENLKKLDQDGDGTVSREEMGPRGPGRFGPPAGERPGRGAGGPPAGARPGRGGGRASADFESAPVPKGDRETKILEVLDDMDQNQRRGNMNVPAEDGRLLRLLTEALGAKTVVEIGTSNGYSGIWFSLALGKTGGKLITHEIDADRAKLARENFERAGVTELVTLVEGNAHEEVKNVEGPIDLLFLDADKEGYLDYLEQLLPKVRAGGLIVAHNMNARQAYPPFVEAITTNPELETLFLHMDGSGVAVSMKKR